MVKLEQLGVLRERLPRFQRAACDTVARILRVLSHATPAIARRALRYGAHLTLLRQVPRWNPPREPGYASLIDLYERRAATLAPVARAAEAEPTRNATADA